MVRKLLLVIAAMALSCAMSRAQTVKVGIINTYSGPLVAIGECQMQEDGHLRLFRELSYLRWLDHLHTGVPL